MSDVKLLEETVRLEPLEDAPFHGLIDLLQESGMTPTQARRRGGDVRREGLRRLIKSDTRLTRKARGELRRTASCGPIDKHDPFCVVLWGYERPGYYGNSTSGYVFIARAAYVLKLLRRLASAPPARART